MKPQETFDFQIRKAWIALSKMYNEQVAQYGLTVAMGFALLNIDITKGTPSTSLGPKMGMESTSLSRLLNSLEKQALISRESNPNDGRSVLVKLTKEGLKMRDRSRQAVLDFNHQVLAEVSEEEVRSFFKVMSSVSKVIDTHRAEELLKMT
ncbi:MAG: MarR family transcriptional regulator [Schleiferiaceae bacterium]|jgi:DNA-binding MarR family transcriptional regulator|nr:MarR family transcriptional regulator [Schleiferiaceae bacterium]